jgi:hypothetical protein
MDVDKLAIDLLLKGMTQEQQTIALESIKDSVAQAKTIQKQRIGENVNVVIQALRKMEADLRGEYSDVADKLSERITSIKDGQDGRNGSDGRAGKDGRPGRDGLAGAKGADGLPGADGIDGVDGVSVTDASIDFDGSLIISLSNGRVINVGEVVSQDLADKIQVISTMSTNGAVGIKDEGTSVSTGVKNINFVGATVTATASGDDVTVNVSAGTGTVTSVAATAGTGISVTGSPITTTGTLNITNTAPDQVVALTGSGGTTVTGTYPSFTISSSGGSGTVTSVDVSGGTTGLTTSGGPITTTGTITLAGTLAVANGGTGNATGTATINANLTGDVTSVGNATAIAAGVIVNADINASAAIVDTKLATISTALKVSNSATTATNANTASAIVARDASGNFSAGTITASLTGNASTVTTNANLTGDVTSVGNASTLATVNSNVGAFTNANITVNAKGLITAAASGSPGGVTSVTGTSPVVSSGGTTPAISLATGYGDTLNPYASKTANFVLAAPNGSAGVPTFRAVVAADVPTLNQSTTGSAATLTTGRTIAVTGDLAYTSPSFDGSANVTAAGTLATVNTNVGSFTAANITVNAKGLITAAANGTAGATLSNDTTTASNLFPLFASATSGTPTTIFTSNAQYLYKPSTGELQARVPVASNGITVNSQTVATSYTIAVGFSGMSTGPITVSGGAAVTLSAGSRWVVL